MLEHVIALRAILGDHARAMSVVDNIVLSKPVVAVMDRHTPLRRTIDRVADKRELVAVSRGLTWSEVMMEMDRIAPDLVGSQLLDLSLFVEFRVVQHAHACSPHL